VVGNDGHVIERDQGHEDISFEYFCACHEAKQAQLQPGEVRHEHVIHVISSSIIMLMGVFTNHVSVYT
jgi:hypothetical protein